jgi:aminotransferase in exopolysaccharide biosynthesis
LATVDPRFEAVVELVHGIYGPGEVPLHRPVFAGREREALVDCIDSNFVSSVGPEVGAFESAVAGYTGAAHAVATENGTAALHVALLLAGVRAGDEVITQAMTFVATCNAIRYCGAEPVFVDIDHDTLGMGAEAVARFLASEVEVRDGVARNRRTGARIAACLPMHTFGQPCRIEAIAASCREFGIPVVEDAAESLGSFVGGRHTGTFGLLGTLSFNGNKVITTGGGGMVITNDPALATRAKHLTTTAKQPHPYAFFHDEVGYNYRMPNLNATLGCAQFEKLDWMLQEKRAVALRYRDHFAAVAGMDWIGPVAGTRTNHWLNGILLRDRSERDEFLEYTNGHGVMTRPAWRLMPELPMFSDCWHDGIPCALEVQDRLVNLPSSVPGSAFQGGVA